MEVGCDYLLLRNKYGRHLIHYLGAFIMGLGGLLIAVSGAYYIYSHEVGSGLREQNFSLPVTEVSDYTGPAYYMPALSIEQNHMKIEEFEPVRAIDGAAPGTLAKPTRILVPALDVDSMVTEIQVLKLEDSQAYETPKFTVGHIPDTVSPGELGASWFFGHLETPLSNEGSVFFRLPEIPELLRRGEIVHIIVESDTGFYLYQVTSSKVLHQRDTDLFKTGSSTIQLVTCVPTLVYDHRLVVSGQLVGIIRA